MQEPKKRVRIRSEEYRRKQRERALLNYHTNKRLVDEIKFQRGCISCHSKNNLEFHHRDPSTKIDKVSHMVSGERNRLLAEIEKCDVICNKCHNHKHRYVEGVKVILIPIPIYIPIPIPKDGILV